jgi:hypothetical protein
MRAVLVMLLASCAGCTQQSTSIGPFDPGGSIGGAGCRVDADCGSGEVCARVGGCWVADQVRYVFVTWTVNGGPASAAACDQHESLELDFQGSATDAQPHLGFAPVPCAEGKFTVDKMPTVFTYVELGEPRALRQSATIDDASGEAAIDLVF